MDSFYKSSTGSGDVALTLKAGLISLVPLFIGFAKMNGIELAESEVVNAINVLSTFAAASVATFGLIRKVYFYFKNKTASYDH